MNTRDELVARLEKENDDLRALVDELKEQLGMGFEAPPQMGLTASEAKLFGVLMKRDLLTKRGALTALYCEKDEAAEKIVDVFICKLRKKLSPFELTIETRWGTGYYLTPKTKAAVRALLAQFGHGRAA